ncbi:putative rhamnogalacturonate lyase A [Rhizoctonia solani]|uniref:rhamnogalacturonan endolyase n=1 Tax=Rhizoctonia solani TaxID=456999 RepID=A0A0K6FT64_9AGAM|nr:putative rhamnogalacturonate lyase A [Rhizoctonia solani]
MLPSTRIPAFTWLPGPPQITTAEPSAGELRFIARLNTATLPDGPVVSRIIGNSGAIEDDDVFLISGQSRSKFYSSHQFIDGQVHGVTGSGIGAYMIIPGTGYEASSGGPFFRDINNQGSAQQELYFCMISGDTQTEAHRMGLHGPYLLQFTTGAAPSAEINLAFWDGLGVTDWIPTSGRGYVKGKASGASAAFADLVVVGWSNLIAQYWARAESNGNYYSPATRPGTYTMTMYKSELAVATSTVTITARSTIAANIQSQGANPTVVWQIGDFDGTPRGLLNSDMIETMQGINILAEGCTTSYDVGPATVRFGLSSSQLGARTLEIGVTLAFKGASADLIAFLAI